jgi:hypothetical protein
MTTATEILSIVPLLSLKVLYVETVPSAMRHMWGNRAINPAVYIQVEHAL